MIYFGNDRTTHDQLMTNERSGFSFSNWLKHEAAA